MSHLSLREQTDALNIPEITRLANEQAHEVAVAADAKFGGDYVTKFTTVFNFLFRKLLMPATDETPGWVTKLANYFSADAEIDEVQEKVGSNELEYNDRGDPLNQAEFVELTVRFKRNGSGPVKDPIVKAKIELSVPPGVVENLPPD